MRLIVGLSVLGGLLLSGCGRTPVYEPRRFPTAEQALVHWHDHEGEFRQLLTEWQRSGVREFFSDPDSWWWNQTHVSKVWWGGWRVTQPGAILGTSDGTDVSSLADAARMVGVSADLLVSLLQRAKNLELRSFAEVVTPAGRSCTRLDLEGGWMGRPNGFLYCRGSARSLRIEQVHGSWLCPPWVQEPASELSIVDEDWAYFGMSPGVPDGVDN